MRRLFIIALLLTLIGCTARRFNESVVPLHVDPSFETAVKEGRHLLIFPIITDTHFISYPSFEELSEPLDLRHDRIKLTWYMTYRAELVDSVMRKKILSAEDVLLHERMLDIPPKLYYFDSTPFRFLQLFRIRESYIINDGKGQKRKHVKLDGEVWDVRKRGVVWRSSAVVETNDGEVSDHKILLRCVELLYETLPKFYFNSIEQEW